MPLLQRILRARLCPKALVHNISEYHPVRDLFQLAKARGWSAKEMADSWVIARGIRGREGVQVLLEFLTKNHPRWHEYAYTETFVNVFEGR